VGGVSERAGAKAGGSNPFGHQAKPSRVVAVKGIPVFGKVAPFAGRHRNEGLGRSVGLLGYLPGEIGAPVTTDVQRVPRRGTPSACANQAHAPDALHDLSSHAPGDASFARSGDPCTSILTMLRAQARRWGVRVDIAVGQTCASRRNRHRGSNGRTERGSPRVTALAREAAWHVRKGRRSRSPSLRGSKSPGLVARTS
jgi:hypothetical protein